MTAIFTPAEIEEIRAQAKEEAKELLIKELLGEVKQKLQEGAVAQDTPKTETESDGEDWVIFPTPSAEEEFNKINIYGVTLRVNKSGTSVEMFKDGQWHKRPINQKSDGNDPRSARWVVVSNSMCSASRGRSGVVSVAVGRLVLEAFVEMPQYIQDVYYTKNGPSILFGINLVEYANGDRKDASLNNVRWLNERSFKKAVRKKLASNRHLSLS